MNLSLPYPFLPLLCASLLFSAFVVAVAAFVIAVSPALWIVPVAFILTLTLHAIFILLSNTEENAAHSLRVFSVSIVVSYFLTAAVWTAVLAVLLLDTVKLFLGHIPSAPTGRGWAMIAASAVSLLETALLLVIAVQIYKHRQRLRYKEKWTWKPSATSSQWSITHS